MPMEPRKERSPWLWLLLIPAQLVILVLSLLGGASLDAAIFSGGSGQGHGVPIFSVLLPLLAGLCTVIAVIVALVGLIVGLVRRSRRRRAAMQPPQPPEGDEPPCS